MHTDRFRINVACAQWSDIKYEWFVLERNKPITTGWFSGGIVTDNWVRAGNTFKTREEARAFYEKIKDLPEYLP